MSALATGARANIKYKGAHAHKRKAILDSAPFCNNRSYYACCDLHTQLHSIESDYDAEKQVVDKTLSAF